jgi:hypothetical protein
MKALACAVLGLLAASWAWGATLDDFNRPNGMVGGKWVRDTTNVAIESNALRSLLSGATVVYDSVLSSVQTVQTRWSTFGGQAESNLLLLVQGTAPTSPLIEVRYDDNAGTVAVNTYDGNWQNRGVWNLRCVSGDTLSAGVDSLREVHVWHGSTEVGHCNLVGWAYRDSPGRVGILQGKYGRLDWIAVGSLTVPPPPVDSTHILLTWTWPTLNDNGTQCTDLGGAMVYWRIDQPGSEWTQNIGISGAGRQGQRAKISLPWSWFPHQPLRFRVTANDKLYNESPPSNEVVRAP